MPAHFWAVVNALAVQIGGRLSLPDRLCRAVVRVLPVDSASLSMSLGPRISVPVGASDNDAVLAERMEYTLGEGPITHAGATRAHLLIPDLAVPTSAGWTRWPLYTSELLSRTRLRGVFVFPLLTEGLLMGSLNLYRHSPGGIGDVTEVAAIATLIARQLLVSDPAAHGDDEPDQRWLEGATATLRYQVWRAQGRVMHVNDIDAQPALDLLRARAYSDGRLLEDIAVDILTGHLPVPNLGPPN